MRADLMMRRILGIGCAVAALYAGVLGITASAQEAAPEPTPEAVAAVIAEPDAPPATETAPAEAATEPEPPAETATPPEPAPVTPPGARARSPRSRASGARGACAGLPGHPGHPAGRQDQLGAEASPGQLEVGSWRCTQA